MNEVALHPEGVDRNFCCNRFVFHPLFVALHPEGVDRNIQKSHSFASLCHVALHPEGVDRNPMKKPDLDNVMSRPPPGGRG